MKKLMAAIREYHQDGVLFYVVFIGAFSLSSFACFGASIYFFLTGS